MTKRKTDLVVVGAGPAGIAVTYEAYKRGYEITWIDPTFQAGDFGTILRDVPGNTVVSGYRTVFNTMYTVLDVQQPDFHLSSLPDAYTCPLSDAAEPLYDITKELRQRVFSIEGSVETICTTEEGIELCMPYAETQIEAKNVILAVGAEPKRIELGDKIEQVHPNVLFVKSDTERYLEENKESVGKFAVVGSSHSAALAVMHLLQAEIPVKQLMNKPYKFAEVVTEGGIKRTKYDNTGLKGSVAEFTKKLLQAKGVDQGVMLTAEEEGEYKKYAELWGAEVGPSVVAEDERLLDCTHACVCIGYRPRSSLTIDGEPLSSFSHDPETARLSSGEYLHKEHIYGAGIAYPELKSFPEGDEFAVGVTKFPLSAARLLDRMGLFAASKSGSGLVETARV